MSDAGVPSPLATTQAANAHTTTQQWQSFELRMRQRRAERCRLRAEAAIDAGLFDDAREALEEAGRLHPDLAGLLLAEERLANAVLRKHGQAPAASHTGRRALAAAVIALAVGAGTWMLVGDWDGTFPWRPQTSVTATDAAQPSDVTLPAPDHPTAPVTDPESHPGAIPVEDVPKVTPVEPEPSNGDPGDKRTIAPPAQAVVIPPPEPNRASSGDASPLPMPQLSAPAAGTPMPIPLPTTPLPTEAPLTAVTTAGPPTSVAPPGPAPAVEVSAKVNPEGQVRAALSRYEAAYSTLNTAAARAIWPSVDAGALARAFGSLESQQISLGSCSIGVVADGRSARANCVGTATWTPKVGGGRKTQPRNWVFELAQNGSEWQIVRATTR